MTKPSDEAVRDKIAALPAFGDLAARLHDAILSAGEDPELVRAHAHLAFAMPANPTSTSP